MLICLRHDLNSIDLGAAGGGDWVRLGRIRFSARKALILNIPMLSKIFIILRRGPKYHPAGREFEAPGLIKVSKKVSVFQYGSVAKEIELLRFKSHDLCK